MAIRRLGGLVEEELTGEIIAGFLEVYHTLGYGHSERSYMNALDYELRERKHSVAREVSTRVFYKGIRVGYHLIDMLVDDKVVIEAKASESLPPYAERQLQNYLRATRLEVGLLLYFGPKPKPYRLFCPNA